jgi:primosomal protein N'
MEKKDAQAANSGIPEELLKDIDAQYAIISSAVKLINQLRQDSRQKTEKDCGFGEWVYNMDFLDKWIHRYTERRKLQCPHCKAEKTFSCTTCNNEAKYHDEL